jgi:hypothetical protein
MQWGAVAAFVLVGNGWDAQFAINASVLNAQFAQASYMINLEAVELLFALD